MTETKEKETYHSSGGIWFNRWLGRWHGILDIAFSVHLRPKLVVDLMYLSDSTVRFTRCSSLLGYLSYTVSS